MSDRDAKRMTHEEFLAWMTDVDPPVFVTPPFEVVPCVCGDPNCKGWRFVERPQRATEPARCPCLGA
jgi:hypothetical protein